ncbi:MAG: PAS domain S-box protein [Methanosarcinaceae archaeon]
MIESLRKSGIDIIGDVSWGTHFCQFFQTKEDLMDILVPYFKAGLENNEFCMWIVSQPSEAEEAKEALKRAISDFDTYLENGQIEFIPYTQWYLKEGNFDSERVLNGWVEKLNQALTNGCDGLRLGNSFRLENEDWNDFADYEGQVDDVIGNYQMIALCTYPLDRCNATEIIDVVINHQFALIKREGKWEQIESSRRKKAEEKIQNLANIVEYSNDAIITKSLDGIITTWNKGAEQIYGYSAKEILGKPISILEPSILVEEAEELAELIKQGDKIHNYETLRLRKDGRIINVSLTLSPVFDASGKLTDISVIARDITKSKIAEEKLRKNEERYRIATEQTGQVVYEYDLRTDQSSWAGAIEEVTGYSFEEIQKLGKEVWIKNIHLTDMNRGDEKLQRVRKAGGRFKEELRLRRKDGTCIYIENHGVWLTDHEGQPYGAIGVLKDISERKLSSKNLQESERKYRSFVQNFHGIAFQLDENFVPVLMHGAVEEITGYGKEEFLSRIKWEDIIHPEDLPLLIKEREKIRSSQSTDYEKFEVRIKHRNGRIRWVDEIYQKIQGVDGKPEFYQGTIYDVTERKETEKFLASIETARKKEIHHRIKNNLQVISSLLDLQAEKFNNRECIKDSEVREAFRESQERVISMALIHEELYKGGELDTLNFSSYVEELTKNLFQTYRLGNASASLNLNLEENIFLDMDTAVPLGIIINELVSNSLKHAFANRDNGKIQIKLCREESPESKDNRAGNNNEDLKGSSYILTVSDNGVGVPESFDLENPDGLGIQLVTILVDQLDGELGLKRDDETEFTIRFIVVQKKQG